VLAATSAAAATYSSSGHGDECEYEEEFVLLTL
jgi:hypothetical protein